MGTEMSANADLITVETYVRTTRGNNLKTSFSYTSQNVKKKKKFINLSKISILENTYRSSHLI